MSLISKIASSWAFSERPMEIFQIPDLYTPFSELSGEKPENFLDLLDTDNLFYLIEGKRGVGKSTFTRYIAYCLYESDNFIILLDSFGNRDYTDPNIMAKWILSAISNAVDLYVPLDSRLKEYVIKLMSRKVTFGKSEESGSTGKFGGWLNIIPQILRFESGVELEIKSTADTHIEREYFLSERVRCINDLLHKIFEKGGFSRCTLIIDGLDHMQINDITQFASNNFPWLSQLTASIILTSYTEYREHPEFKKHSEKARILSLPSIDSEDSLIKMLDKRVNALETGKNWESVCDKKATSLLFDWYNTKSEILTLRKIIRAINYAAKSAIDEGKEIIETYHMSLGLKEII